MRKIFCDRCNKEITADVTMVFDHELCHECAELVEYFINFSLKTTTMDGVRDICKNISKGHVGCPFAVKDDNGSLKCVFETQPRNWSSEKETYSKVLNYIVDHPNIGISLRKY